MTDARKVGETVMAAASVILGGRATGGSNAALKRVSTKSSAPRANYSSISDHPSAGPGKAFTQAQKNKIRAANKKANNGGLKSDLSGKSLVDPKKHVKGQRPPANEAHIDHIVPKGKGGTNSSSNAQILSRNENLRKAAKTGTEMN